MRRLHLIRHAPTLVDPAKSSADWVLKPDVAPAIESICNRLNASKIRRVVSSPQTKALQTAQYVAEYFKVPIEVYHGLEEHHRTECDFIEDECEFRDRIAEFFAKPEELVFGQETAAQASVRFVNAIRTLMHESNDDELLVSHGTVLSLLLAHANPGSQMEFWSALQFPDYVPLDWPSLRILPSSDPARQNSHAQQILQKSRLSTKP